MAKMLVKELRSRMSGGSEPPRRGRPIGKPYSPKTSAKIQSAAVRGSVRSFSLKGGGFDRGRSEKAPGGRNLAGQRVAPLPGQGLKLSSLPDLAHLAQENKIPASVRRGDAVLKFGEKAVSQAEERISRGEVLPKDIHEATRVSQLRDRNAKAGAEGTRRGGSFDSQHPRHPSGSSKGGEFAPK